MAYERNVNFMLHGWEFSSAGSKLSAFTAGPVDWIFAALIYCGLFRDAPRPHSRHSLIPWILVFPR
jgi:hypothetical protein